MKRRLRVLHLFTNAFDPPWNWDEDPISRLTWPASSLVRHTDRTRFDLTIGTLRQPPPEAAGIPGLRLHALPIIGRRNYPRAILRLARWLRLNKIDVVQTHLFDASVVGQVAARLAGTPVTIVTGPPSHEFSVMPRGLAFAVDVLCTALAGHAIVPSGFMADTLAETHAVPRARIALVPHGLDARRLASSAEPRLRLRRELGLEDAVVVGAVGRFFWIKQYAHLVRAFAAAARHRPDLALVMVGEGQQRDELLSLARDLGVADRMRILGLRGDITSVLAAFDVFAHPALTESFGLVLIEAMAAGRPVLSTAVGIAPQVIDDQTGVLVPPRDPEAFTAGLLRLLEMQPRWSAMGARAREIAGQFTADRMVAAYESYTLDWFASET